MYYYAVYIKFILSFYACMNILIVISRITYQKVFNIINSNIIKNIQSLTQNIDNLESDYMTKSKISQNKNVLVFKNKTDENLFFSKHNRSCVEILEFSEDS